MNSLAKKLALGLLTAGVLATLSWGGWYLYRISSRPTLERSGGTILVYELETESVPADYRPEDMAAALKLRIDPRGVLNISVRPVGDNRMEVTIPRWGDHEEHVYTVKDLIARVGRLEFEILANKEDDAWALLQARKYMEQAQKEPMGPERAALVEACETGKPPPSPREDDGNPSMDAANGLGRHTYAWVKVGRSYRQGLHLDDASEGQSEVTNDGIIRYVFSEDGPNRSEQNQAWHDAAVARGEETVRDGLSDSGKQARMYEKAWRQGEQPDLAKLQKYAVIPLPMWLGRPPASADSPTVLYSRMLGNRNLLPPSDGGRRIEYFQLVRNTEPDKEVTGQHLTSAFVSTGRNMGPAVGFRLDQTGGNRLYELTTKNAPSPDGFHRQLAIILDGEITTAPVLNAKISTDAIIEGDFTANEVDRYVTVLNSGALPAMLKPLPVTEVVVEPK
jgi:preprotein translocase subunit SecD